MRGQSPCKSCPFRERYKCTLLNLTFPQTGGVLKCYATQPGSYEEFLRDISQAVSKPIRAKSLAKRLGIPINTASNILLTLRKKGFLRAEKPSSAPHIYYPVKRPSIEELKPLLWHLYMASILRGVAHE